MRVFAFQGTRFGGAPREAGRLAAPPYDQIDDALRDLLHREPHHFAHLSRPAANGDPHAHAAALHRRWLAEGVLAVDPAPALYPYDIRLAGGGRRLGLTAMIGLEAPESGVIRPHERTITKTVAERLALTRAIRADLGPLLLLAEDGGALDPLLAEDVDGGELVAEHEDAAGHLHRLYRVSDEARLERYRQALSGAAGLIADGHHRYKTATLYAEEVGARAGAMAAKLAVVTSLESPALAIDPIHRALSADRRVDLGRLAACVLDEEPATATDGAALAAAVAAAKQPACGLLTREGARICRLDPARGPSDLPSAASELAVVLLHHDVLPRWGLDAEAAVDGTVLYRSDPAELFRQVQRGELGVGLFLPPIEPALFAAAVARGDLLPPKSTRFLPKVVSGMVWAAHASRLA